jgi:hypothetical protein
MPQNGSDDFTSLNGFFPNELDFFEKCKAAAVGRRREREREFLLYITHTLHTTHNLHHNMK